MPEQRDEARRLKRVKVKYGVDEPIKTAFTRNLSLTGINLGTNNVFAPGTTLLVELEFPERTFSLWSRVMWAKKVPPALAHLLPCGMGLCFLEAGDEWKEFFEVWRTG